MNSGVYKIQSILKPNRIYIGSAVNFTKRWKGHLFLLKNRKHKSPKLQCHVNKYGLDDLIFSIVAICHREELKPIDGMVRPEQFFMWAYDPWFNTCKIAGSKLGQKASLETRMKLSKSHMGNPNPMKGKKTGKPSWNKGKHSSEETKQKLRESHRGIYPSEETLLKRSESLKGKIPWNKGISPPQEQRDRQSKILKGRTWEDIYGEEGAAKRRTKEYRDKQSKSQIGRKHSKESNKKRSESMKRTLQLKRKK